MAPIDFLLAQLSAMSFAGTNLIDTHLFQRFNKLLEKVQEELGENAPVHALLILSTIASIAAIPFFIIFPPLFGDTFAFWPEEGWGVLPYYISLGVLNTILIWAYLKALFHDGNPGAVIIFYQFVPVLSYFMSWAILGETVTTSELVALAVIFIGTSLMAIRLDTEDGEFRFRWVTAMYMTIAAACWAAGSVMFKYAAQHGNDKLADNLWQTLAWEHAILFIIGMGLLRFNRTYRNSFVAVFKATNNVDKGWNVINECIYMIGVTLMHTVTLNVVVVMSMMAQTFQSLYVWLGGIILATLGVSSASFGTKWSNIQMMLAISVSGTGAWLLWLASERGVTVVDWLEWLSRLFGTS